MPQSWDYRAGVCVLGTGGGDNWNQVYLRPCARFNNFVYSQVQHKVSQNRGEQYHYPSEMSQRKFSVNLNTYTAEDMG